MTLELRKLQSSVAAADPRLGFFIAAMIGIQLASLKPFINTFHSAFAMDFANFWAAGGTAGTRALMDPQLHGAWQIAHNLRPQAFVYLPAFSWLYAPLSHIPLLWAFALNNVCMALFCIVIAVIVARVYGLKYSTAGLIMAAWYPVFYTVETGQNTLIALTLILAAVYGISRDRPAIAGLAIGALMYKPTDALVFLAFLVARKDVRALSAAFSAVVVLYFISVAATAGDWSWPQHYFALIQGYYHGDFAPNAFKAFSLPTVLMEIGVPASAALALGAALACGGAVVASRLPVLEGASVLPLIALASTPHAWPYELAILVPTICWVWTHAAPRLRNWVLGIAYVVAATWWLTIWNLGFDPIAFVVLGGTAVWAVSIVHRLRSGASAAAESTRLLA